MQALITHQGSVMPMDRAHVNTDDILPARFLKAITKSGYGQHLFRDWRYTDGGETPGPAFLLNQPRYRQVSILLARENLGCGSSREHAPWALYEHGFRVIIAPSIADIFYNNCLNIGLLPVRLSNEQVETLFQATTAPENVQLTIGLPEQCVITEQGQRWHFEIDAFRKEALLQGADAIAHTLQMEAEIAIFEARRAAWLS
jgi:3-isopropylmalate/(R)-2-methylmalate dehydratase small subunit